MILVTGATGLLGAHLLYALLDAGESPRALVRGNSRRDDIKNIFSFNGGNPDALFSRIEWVEGDIRDELSLRDALQGITQVYHCAALVSFNPRDRIALYRTNVEGTARLVDLCLEMGRPKLCFVSSIGALGQSTGQKPVCETDFIKNLHGISWYSRSKYLAEMEVWRAMAEGLEAVIVNPSVILGAGKWDRGFQKIFSLIDRGLPWYTEGMDGFVDVRDVARAMIMLMNKDISGERFILNAENIPFREIQTHIATTLKRKPPAKKIPVLLLEILWRTEMIRNLLFGATPLVTRDLARISRRNSLYSNEKIMNALGFTFRPVEESVREMGEVYLKEKGKT